MKSLVLAAHIVCASAWLGCVLTEAVFEHSIGPEWVNRRFVARLHWLTDCWVEVPLIAGVLITGFVLSATSQFTPALAVKIAFGLSAIVLNAVCVVLVKRRLAHADAGEAEGYERVDRWQHRIGAGVLAGIVGALATGGLRFAAVVA
ncbi:hypothetical protein G3N95_35930 [Paraburkholderia sp. Tr-20389]|uniref:hypothetical protein n=1 Tax=Paraburkholderia sp. Tr-20389 TaxID=2703903 RepID=UPI00197D01F8|nr:hypothetical protein [Paraburkholderia sp. Tr-20389]MBN3758347.1 hypothetical protein [Paraburkholderia sp. Tr-20389]